mmetsp:Transcript_13330/g.24036  ORF Transcript_13330/g.24036 Transcript_13330/m.24036 type:complete len:115 (+) Transcript_13330:72-416(+)
MGHETSSLGLEEKPKTIRRHRLCSCQAEHLTRIEFINSSLQLLEECQQLRRWLVKALPRYRMYVVLALLVFTNLPLSDLHRDHRLCSCRWRWLCEDLLAHRGWCWCRLLLEELQ